ncbi:saccharopine dehydrogenase NADP-binding domain-containing protein [Rhodanobacter sp. T12-5]|uniref:saccharopine dehydrogenase NADP-binding domain-containing protein n=1 Tax=Rhodanobacter sp. T12-5 TaxID=2024611 RepID=UPI0011ED92E0|nr:saccharopine dehydrogenase NADP-binding domain-containing protein [Rhodanobacter sp. T12-5]KAA0070856.1 saccharopine dehydrogenase [Rhodanobacter sp. T12-5]
MTTHPSRRIAVYGAYGHTGRFVLAELRRRGFVPVACGRDAARLHELAAETGVEVRVAATDDAAALDAAFAGTAAVLHCAGPFLDTAAPVLDAALRARIDYLDVAAEQRAVTDTLARDGEAKAAGVTVLPAMAFYGGLADLLASAALDGATDADAVDIAVALDGWHPTRGTRLTGDRNHYPRTYIEHGRTCTVPDPAPVRETDFPAPFGTQETVLLPLSETVVLSHHVACRNLHSWMNLAPLRDLRDPATPTPTAADDSGRSAQRFVVDVRVRRGDRVDRAVASGRDIYAVTAPLLVEALQRILDGRVHGNGSLTAGQAFDARDFLDALADAAFTVTFEANAKPAKAG